MGHGAVVAAVLLVAGGVMLPVEGLVKKWRYNWNLDNGDNWESGNLGCGNSEAILPSDLDFGWTFVGRSSLSLASIVLPLSGGIVFGEGGSLILGSSGANCRDAPRTIRWNHFGRDKWWDPLAWDLPEELTANATAVPDMHRVPCMIDVAVLPNPAEYLSPIHFEPPLVSITALTMAGKNFSTSEFTEYVSRNASSSVTGFSSARDRVLLYAEDVLRCSDPNDCLCHPRGQEQLKAVCSSRLGSCPDPLCLDPINMTGFCCPSCGTELTLPASYSGNRASLTALLGTNRQGGKGVATYVGLMTDHQYHVFVAPREASEDWSTAAAIIKTLLQQILGSDEAQALVEVSSGASMASRTAGSGSTVAAVLVVLAVSLLLAAALYYGHKRGKLHYLTPSEANFRFRRMSMVAFRRMSRVSLHSDMLASRSSSDMSATTSTTGTVPTYSAQTGGLRFMNPSFSKSTASLAAMPIDPEGGGDNDQDHSPPELGEAGSLENPMYKAYMFMDPEEKKATDYSCSSGATGPSPPKPPRLDDKAQGAVRFSQLCTIEEDLNTVDDSSEANTDGEKISTQDGAINAGNPPNGKEEDTKIIIEIHEEDNSQLEEGGDLKDEKSVENAGLQEQNLVDTGLGDLTANGSPELEGGRSKDDAFGNEGLDVKGPAAAASVGTEGRGDDNFMDNSSLDPLSPSAPELSDGTACIDFGFE